MTDETGEGDPSPIYPHLEIIFIKIGQFLEGVIPQEFVFPEGTIFPEIWEESKKPMDKFVFELSKFIYGDKNKLYNFLKTYRRGDVFSSDIGYFCGLLTKFSYKLEQEITSSGRSKNEIESIISRLEHIFDKYIFSILGGFADNPFHKGSKLMSFAWTARLTAGGTRNPTLSLSLRCRTRTSNISWTA